MSVYTELSATDIRAILADYDLGELRDHSGIAAGIENSNFFVDTERGRFVLTIFERMEGDELPWFMDLMCHLSTRGLPCPAVQKRHDGTLLFRHGDKWGCIVSCLDGRVHENLSLPQLEQAGATLARLHQAGADYRSPRPCPTGAEWLKQTAETVRAPLKARYGADAAALLDDELRRQQAARYDALPQGIIHGDYFCDNILFAGDRLTGVIDFYYAHNAPFAMDVAIALNALAIRLESGDDERIGAFLDGYRSVRALQPDEREALPALLRLAALRFWLSRLYDAFFPRDGAMIQIKDPEEYRRKLLRHREPRP